MHCFQACTAAIFVTAISEYDQFMFEDKTKNRLIEAIEMYDEVVNSEWLGQTTMMLFLNKKDLFHKKFTLEHIPLNVTGDFPEAPNDFGDEKGALEFLQREFTKKRVKYHLPTYVHITSVTDPENVRAVFKVVTDVIVKQNLKNAGLD